MTQYESKEPPTRPDLKRASQVPPGNDLSPIDAVNGNVGSVSGYLEGRSPLTLTGEKLVTAQKEEKRPQGRPTVLVPENVQELYLNVRNGLPIKTSCTLAGISVQTLSRWRAEEKVGNRPDLTEFFSGLDRARAEAELKLLQEALQGDLKAWSEGPSKSAKWALERLFGKDYAPRINMKLEEMGDIYLDIVTRVCSQRDCGCYQEIIAAISASEAGEGET